LADNVAITAGSGTTIAADDIGAGVLAQRIKPVWGIDGTGTDTSVANPLPSQATQESSQMTAAGTVLTPLFASISISSSGDNTIVVSPGAKVLRVLSYVLVADGAVAVKWGDTTPAYTSGPMSLAANGGVCAPFSPIGHIQTASAKGIVLNLSSAVGVRGHLTYISI
jgi:hypothetical protein